MANVNRSGPPNADQGASGPNVNRQGPPMNSALGRRRIARAKFNRATPKRRMGSPSRPM